jgi:hypothetical protein
MRTQHRSSNSDNCACDRSTGATVTTVNARHDGDPRHGGPTHQQFDIDNGPLRTWRATSTDIAIEHAVR